MTGIVIYNKCEECGGLKDSRAKRCHSCNMKYRFKENPQLKKEISKTQSLIWNDINHRKQNSLDRKEWHIKNKNSIEYIERNKKIALARSKQILPVKDTLIEIKIQKLLSLLQLEYMAHKYVSEITHAYQCDIFIPKQDGILQKTIIECDGDYFHGNPLFYSKLNKSQEDQKERDKLRTKELEEKGFRVIRLWESDIKLIDLNKFKEIICLNIQN